MRIQKQNKSQLFAISQDTHLKQNDTGQLRIKEYSTTARAAATAMGKQGRCVHLTDETDQSYQCKCGIRNPGYTSKDGGVGPTPEIFWLNWPAKGPEHCF